MSSQLEDLFAVQLASAGLPTPEREMQFHHERQWRFDFCWPAAMVAVEIEGGTWVRGRHTRPKGFEEDCIKRAEANLAGWMVLSVTGAMVKSGAALNYVARALARFGD